MTTLIDLFRNRIRESGPISLAEYVAVANMHPQLGYYNQPNVFGAEGDFITAPEISQVFGELIGLALAQSWLAQGKPNPFALVELGPGRGKLMADIRRATGSLPGFRAAADIHLVEQSPQMRMLQMQELGAVTHHDTVKTLPQMPTFLIANEFFDALPHRQFSRGKRYWHETCVDWQDDKLVLGPGPELDFPELAQRLADTGHGDIVEYCPILPEVMGHITQRIGDHGGAGIIVDYGDWRSKGATVQAVKNHRFFDILAAPGTSDISAHVDFEQIALNTPGLLTSQMVPQGVFLEQLGITNRCNRLCSVASPEQADQIVKAHRRLTHPDEMGHLFKVIGFAATPDGMPPGLPPQTVMPI